MEFEIRPATTSDLTAIESCVAAAYEPYIDRMGKRPGPMNDDYRTVLAQHDTTVVERSDGAVVGFMVLILADDQILLDNIAVLPEAQGQGLGKRLLLLAEEKAQAAGYRAIDVYTHVTMVENIDLYKRLGYVETERKVVNGYDRVYMAKALGKPLDIGGPSGAI